MVNLGKTSSSTTTERTSEPVLCYVDNNCAWFTTAPIKGRLGEIQWGDDWDDAPYEHNAGEPYEWDILRKHGPYTLTRIYFEGNYTRPCDYFNNSPWSVYEINQGAAPWLKFGSFKNEPLIVIPAGTTLSEFKRLVRQAGGDIFVLEDAE